MADERSDGSYTVQASGGLFGRSHGERNAANLRRELPRIPFMLEFHPIAEIGENLTEMHTNYEKQPEYSHQDGEGRRKTRARQYPPDSL